jgi:hypothetical protein
MVMQKLQCSPNKLRIIERKAAAAQQTGRKGLSQHDGHTAFAGNPQKVITGMDTLPGVDRGFCGGNGLIKQYQFFRKYF